MIYPTVNKELRGLDPTGHGYYGAKRGTRKHKGLDILAAPGEDVKTPIDGFVTKIGQVYTHTKEFKYIDITNDVYRARLMYAAPLNIKINDRFKAGDVVGIIQNVSKYWGNGMKNHLHLELYKYGLLTDPEPVLLLEDLLNEKIIT